MRCVYERPDSECLSVLMEKTILSNEGIKNEPHPDVFDHGVRRMEEEEV